MGQCPDCGGDHPAGSPQCPGVTIGSTVAGKYELTGIIGAGGMGTIYRARHLALGGKEVAIKMLHADLITDSSVVERFRREARAAASLNHDGIINSNDFLILELNFGKTESGGAAVWVSDNDGVYRLNIDDGALEACVTGFPATPMVHDINPDSGEAWVVVGTSYVYVISPFVPDGYDVATMTGWLENNQSP